ncbi:peptidoglycan recognition family protein [Marinactinospora rubrisoli]|uniref:Peptidoglycan recognition family protein n=1 Tax=Marinactinospora rubrisoli TaxID=2715399 RepID=A0ABW2KBS1_9ACTN
MQLVSRSDLGWGASGADAANPTRGLVIHYDGSNQGLADKKHSACVSYWKSTRDFHVNTNGWADIGYSYGACPHGYVFEGRGLKKYQAAQGTTAGNRDWYSVTLMSGPSEKPPGAQINAVRELRGYLMERGVAGTLRGHRDFASTTCPGDILYRLVQDGTFSRKGDRKDDDMPEHRRYRGRDLSVRIPRGEWRYVPFNQRGADRLDTFDYSVAFGPVQFVASVGIRLTGLAPGAEVQLRAVEVTGSGDDWEIAQSYAINSPQHTNAGGHFTHTWNGNCVDGNRLRFYVTHFSNGDQPVVLESSDASVHTWSY